MWTIAEITSNDGIEILDCLAEIMRAIDGDEDACDMIGYNPDYSDLWLCFAAEPHAITITLTDKADIDGAVRGAIYAVTTLAYDYVKLILEDAEKEEM